MALNSLLLKLEQTGDLFLLFKAGFISYKILEHKDMYLTYDSHIKRGMKHSKALQKTADQFEVSDMTAWRAIKSMEQQ